MSPVKHSKRPEMRKILRYVTAVAAIVAALGGVAASQGRADESRALRDRIATRHDIVALSDGVALRPKARANDIRLIEVTAGAVLVNGVAVTGRELRDRLGEDADAVLRLSYLPAPELQAFAAPPPAEPRAAAPADPEPPLESAEPRRPESRSWQRRSSG